ncbi:hypothetical protein ACFODL_15620 [Phenylobacterium terrae]|uniref:Uncharacterized protein n=1 Tax=Phenylobacterium terrae TaxID=2665495 RepID=A0ABW4NAP6_9CAUL
MARKSAILERWRHIAAYTYLFICVFDFVGMPVFYEVVHERPTNAALVDLVSRMPPDAQVPVLQLLRDERRWEPLTLGENGLFHVAFGTILGAAAFTRGRERIARLRRRDPDEFESFESFEPDSYSRNRDLY